MSSASQTPRCWAIRWAAATWNRLWLATPTRRRGRPRRVEGAVDEAQVRGVDLGLRAVRRLRPAVQLGLDLLHRQVGALDQPHLEACAAGLTALRRDGGELVERVRGVGQVRLQHDARLRVERARGRTPAARTPAASA